MQQIKINNVVCYSISGLKENFEESTIICVFKEITIVDHIKSKDDLIQNLTDLPEKISYCVILPKEDYTIIAAKDIEPGDIRLELKPRGASYKVISDRGRPTIKEETPNVYFIRKVINYNLIKNFE